jgi:hypothetical protein
MGLALKWMRGTTSERIPSPFRMLHCCKRNEDTDHSDRRAESMWWDVVLELGLYDARVTMGLGDSPPNDTDVRTTNFGLRLVDISYALKVRAKK